MIFCLYYDNHGRVFTIVSAWRFKLFPQSLILIFDQSLKSKLESKPETEKLAHRRQRIRSDSGSTKRQ